MIFEQSYESFLAACQNITRRRERSAKHLIGDFLQEEVGPDLPNEALIAHLIAEPLLKRVDRRLVDAKNIYLQKFDISQIELFYMMTEGYPQVPTAHAIANQYLHRELSQARQGTLFEIGSGRGVQVSRLAERLATDPGRLERLTVATLDPDVENLAETRRRLSEVSERTGFPITVHPVHALLEHVGPAEYEDLRELARGGPLVVNSAYTLHHTLHQPGDQELRTRLLRQLNRELAPALFTLVEPNADHDNEQLARRLHACWEHFGTVFELIDEADIAPEARFSIKEKFFGREIRDIFGTSDAFRCERHESAESWLLRLVKAGFTPCEEALELDAELPPYCETLRSDGLVRLGYRGLPLIAIFAYRGGPVPAEA